MGNPLGAEPDGRRPNRRPLRLVAAPLPDADGGEIDFHARLTVFVRGDRDVGGWIAELVSRAAPDGTLWDIGGELVDPAHADPPVGSTPLRRWTTVDFDAGSIPALAVTPDRTTRELMTEATRWDRVLAETRRRLTEVRDAAPRVDPVVLSEAARLRDEWRYAVQVETREPRRRRRREVQARKRRFDEYLARFGAATFDDLSTVGTGFGDTTSDVAIREAATAVSIAEQHVAELRRRIDATLAGLRVVPLVGQAVKQADDATYLRPVLLDGVLDEIDPEHARPAFERIVADGRRRQIVLVTASDAVIDWASDLPAEDAAVRRDPASLTAD